MRIIFWPVRTGYTPTPILPACAEATAGRPHRGGGRRGFTLVEILIAMAVFLIGVVAIIGVFPEGLKKSSQSVDDTIASYIVQSVRDALVDAIRRNVSDEQGDTGVAGPADDPNDGYWVRWYHDGLPASGATFQLARTFKAAPTAVSYWSDPIGTQYDLPDYFSGAGAGTGVSWSPTTPTANPNLTAPDQGMLAQVGVGTGTASLMRGWWFPDRCLSNAIPVGGGAPRDAWVSGGSLLTELTPTGATVGDANLGNNNGVEVVRLGTLTGTTANAQASPTVQFPDPLSQHSFQFICEIFNDLTPGGDLDRQQTVFYIPSSPFPDEEDLLPDSFFPDYPHEFPAGSGTPSPAARDADRIRKDYRAGLAKFTYFHSKNWKPGKTGFEAGMSQVQRDEAREEHCVRLFQFLVSFTQ